MSLRPLSKPQSTSSRQLEHGKGAAITTEAVAPSTFSSTSSSLRDRFAALNKRVEEAEAAKKASATTGEQVREATSTAEAFRLVESGAQAEKEGRFEAAYRAFAEGSVALSDAAKYNETDPKIKDLLLVKSQEVAEWADALGKWIVDGKGGQAPRRYSGTVAVAQGGNSGCGPNVFKISRTPAT